MPHYYFDIVEGDGRTLDVVGSDLTDDAAARKQAASLLIDLARDDVRAGDLELIAVLVRDAGGHATFSAKLRIDLSGPSEDADRG